MQISSVTLTNFRCFGPNSVTVSLASLTAFVGANGAGKTALLQALARLFGITAADRSLHPDDFHVPPGQTRDDLDPEDELTLCIDVVLTFPELDAEDADLGGVAECFQQMMVVDAGSPPFCRVRLEATWTKGNLPDGDIDAKLYWVRSADPDPADEHMLPLQAHDRSRIHVHYVPAARDPSKQIRYVSGTIMNRLFNAVEWSAGVRKQVEDASDAVDTAFGAEAGVTSIEEAIDGYWNRLHDGTTYTDVHLRPVGQRLEEIFRHVHAVFSPSPGGNPDEMERLSDGLKSLFYLAMVGASFDLETRVARGDATVATKFSRDRLDPPALTLFAIEEPENHIAPHFLGRIVSALRDTITTGRAQVALTSHSASIMQRVEPTEVRHLRLDAATRTTVANQIRLPSDTSEEYKYIREAVRAFPELYFARVVILGEGDSEEIVLPRIAAALGVETDLSLVSVVPLGGRHVNHFWRLLKDLDIPHLTLLDLDRERDGGGWGRIQYATRELIANGVPRADLLTISEKGKDRVLTESEFDAMRDWQVQPVTTFGPWIERLEQHGVYFSEPLDLDFAMLRAFPAQYKILPIAALGPKIPAPGSAGYPPALEAAVRAVLRAEGGDGSSYSPQELNEFFWYRFLFLGRGKPVTHLHAMTALAITDLVTNAPPVLQRMMKRLGELLLAAPEDET